MQRPQRFTADQVRAARAADLPSVMGPRVKLVKRQGLLVGLCPFHAEKSGSFHVFGDNHFHCFGCSAHGDPIDYVMKIANCSFVEAVEQILGGRVVAPAEIRRLDEAAAKRDAADQAQRDRFLKAAWRLWETARVVTPGDPVWRYMQGRGCLVEPWPDVLRLHPALSHQEFIDQATRRPTRTWLGMVGRVDNCGGAFIGLHRTYLVEAGDRVTQDPDLKARGVAKMTLGECRGGAIRLFGDDLELGLAEGIEDAMSAHLLSGLPVWACLDHGKMPSVQLPFSVGAVTIFADRDKPQVQKGKTWAPEGVGMRSARKLAARLREERRGVRILLPRDSRKDFNDELQARREDRSRMRAGSVEAVAT